MGYNSCQVEPDNNSYFCGSFDNISEGGKFTLGQIKPDEELWNQWGEGDYIATLNDVGVQDEYFTYVDGDWFVCDEFGAPEGDPINDRTLDSNVGYLVYSYLGASLTFSGAVAQGECEMLVDPDHNAYSGNFTPAPLKIGDIVVGEEWNAWGEGDYIATLNNVGVQENYYTCVDGEWMNCDEFGSPFGDTVNESVSFDPNKVLLTYSYLGATLNYPSPIK